MEKKRKLLVFLIVIFVLSGFHFNSTKSISIPNMEVYRIHQVEGSRIFEVPFETDFNCVPSSKAVIRSVEENVRLFMNFRLKQSRLGMHTAVILFAIVFAMALFPCLIYSITIYLYGRCMIPLWRVIRYIHLFDGEKEVASILI